METTLIIALIILLLVFGVKIACEVFTAPKRESAWLEAMASCYEQGYGEFAIWLSYQLATTPHLVRKHQGTIVSLIIRMSDYAFKLQSAQVVCQALDLRHAEQLVSDIIREYPKYGESYYDGASKLLFMIFHSPSLTVAERKAFGQIVQALSDAHLRKSSRGITPR